MKIGVASIEATIEVDFRSCLEFSDNCVTLLLVKSVKHVAFPDNLGSTVIFIDPPEKLYLRFGQNKLHFDK